MKNIYGMCPASAHRCVGSRRVDVSDSDIPNVARSPAVVVPPSVVGCVSTPGRGSSNWPPGYRVGSTSGWCRLIAIGNEYGNVRVFVAWRVFATSRLGVWRGLNCRSVFLVRASAANANANAIDDGWIYYFIHGYLPIVVILIQSGRECEFTSTRMVKSFSSPYVSVFIHLSIYLPIFLSTSPFPFITISKRLHSPLPCASVKSTIQLKC